MNAQDLHFCEIFYVAFVLWREARGESVQTKLGVACSIRNRVIRPSWWGRSYVDVITKKWQYSSITDPNDKQLTTWPNPFTNLAFQECFEVARSVVDGEAMSPVPGADSYFDISIEAPKWATSDKFVGQLGRIKFYNMDMDTEVGMEVSNG
jgi:N-acetylmuramoyl-L-alanine amidase